MVSFGNHNWSLMTDMKVVSVIESDRNGAESLSSGTAERREETWDRPNLSVAATGIFHSIRILLKGVCCISCQFPVALD